MTVEARLGLRHCPRAPPRARVLWLASPAIVGIGGVRNRDFTPWDIEKHPRARRAGRGQDGR